MKRKTVAVFTGSRADYGLLYWLIHDINRDKDLTLKLLVSGSHLSGEFGETYKEILDDGFHIDEKVEIVLSSNSSIGTAKSLGLAVLGYADALRKINPDVIIILGDRYEALAAAQTSMIMKIPIVHLHGGEISEGAYDDSFRHCITKLSYLHGASTEVHRNRIIQLGEDPARVVTVGALGLDHLERTTLMSLAELSESLDFDLYKPYMLVTYHPETLANEDPADSVNALLDALDRFPSHQIIITYPNADNGGLKIIPRLTLYGAENSERVLVVPSLGQIRYLSAVKHSDVVVGNSSSGIIEVPSLNVPTVNIGQRQKGRLSAKSVLHCAASTKAIVECIEQAISRAYQRDDEKIVNPYGQGNASSRVIEMIKELDFSPVKTFYDLEV